MRAAGQPFAISPPARLRAMLPAPIKPTSGRRRETVARERPLERGLRPKEGRRRLLVFLVAMRQQCKARPPANGSRQIIQNARAARASARLPLRPNKALAQRASARPLLPPGRRDGDEGARTMFVLAGRGNEGEGCDSSALFPSPRPFPPGRTRTVCAR